MTMPPGYFLSMFIEILDLLDLIVIKAHIYNLAFFFILLLQESINHEVLLLNGHVIGVLRELSTLHAKVASVLFIDHLNSVLVTYCHHLISRPLVRIVLKYRTQGICVDTLLLRVSYFLDLDTNISFLTSLLLDFHWNVLSCKNSILLLSN